MWEEDTGKNEYIYDCSDYQLAVKVGIVGVLAGLTIVIITQVLILIQYLISNYSIALRAYELGILSLFGFVSSIFASLGYVGVFSMKNSKLGIVFPFGTIVTYCGFRIYLNILAQTGMYSIDIHIFSSYILGYGLAIISGLVLFTLRKVSAHPRFLYLFTGFILIKPFLFDVGWMIITLIPLAIPVYGGFVSPNSMLYSIAFNLVTSFLVIKFFILESRNGCIEENALQEVPFSE